MPRDLPPTTALRAFVRAAHTSSFKDAAADLGLSPSALSRQIQALEEHLAVRLFDRLNPGLALTDDGRRYLDAIEPALGRLQAAQDLFATRTRRLRVSALQSFCESWLVPNLPDLQHRHPDVELEIEATLAYADFGRDAVDVAIRFGRGPWEGLHSEPILDLEVFPVCSPTLLEKLPLRTPADLARHTLIHVVQTPDAWLSWLAAVGAPDVTPAGTVLYDHAGIALSAAESGQGVALSSWILCARRVRDGRLVRPFPQRVVSELTYHFVCRPEDLGNPRIAALRDWLVESLARADAYDASAVAK